MPAGKWASSFFPVMSCISVLWFFSLIAFSEVAEGGAPERQRLATGEEPHALARRNRADLRERDIGGFGGRAQAFGFIRRDRADDFVIVAAGERGFQHGRIAGDDGLGGIR